MSRLTIAGTLLGGVAGAVVATVTVLEYLEINDEGDVAAQLTKIAESGVPLDDPEVLAAARPVAELFSRNVNAIDADDVALLPHIKDAGSGETVTFTLDDGTIVPVTFRWNNVAPAAVVTFYDEDNITQAGWMGKVPGKDCSVLFAGPTRDEPPAGRFQLICQ